VSTAGADRLRLRAALLSQARAFFAERGVTEVQTPLVTTAGVTDVHIDSVRLDDGRFLRTSPEYAHKRLLADGAGDLFELGPVFRAGEHGRVHRTEFTLLEWYRVGWDWAALARETVALVDALAPAPGRAVEFVRWSELVERETGLDYAQADDGALAEACADAPAGLDEPEQLDWLFATRVQPRLPADTVTVVHHFPSIQAALARRDPDEPRWAERFEVFAGGLELANGYRELTDPAEQRARFESDNRRRVSMGREPMPIDSALLDALASGLPECAGVALGFDRLAMLAAGADELGAVRVLDDG
jgi:lysyl-tRNA synthetase class 2